MTLSLYLADSVPDPRLAWAPVLLLILMGVGFSLVVLTLSLWIGPKRTGKTKEMVYESGVLPIGNARGRFNVRYFMVAMIFLVFDVEVVLFYPWATIFPQSAGSPLSGLLLVEMLTFVAILLVAYLYAWGKGVFKWD